MSRIVARHFMLPQRQALPWTTACAERLARGTCEVAFEASCAICLKLRSPWASRHQLQAARRLPCPSCPAIQDQEQQHPPNQALPRSGKFPHRDRSPSRSRDETAPWKARLQPQDHLRRYKQPIGLILAPGPTSGPLTIDTLQCVFRMYAVLLSPQHYLSKQFHQARVFVQVAAPRSSTIRTRSAALRAPSFSMIRARWTSTVRGLMPKDRPASLLDAPSVISFRTSSSRRVN